MGETWLEGVGVPDKLQWVGYTHLIISPSPSFSHFFLYSPLPLLSYLHPINPPGGPGTGCVRLRLRDEEENARLGRFDSVRMRSDLCGFNAVYFRQSCRTFYKMAIILKLLKYTPCMTGNMKIFYSCAIVII